MLQFLNQIMPLDALVPRLLVAKKWQAIWNVGGQFCFIKVNIFLKKDLD